MFPSILTRVTDHHPLPPLHSSSPSVFLQSCMNANIQYKIGRKSSHVLLPSHSLSSSDHHLTLINRLTSPPTLVRHLSSSRTLSHALPSSLRQLSESFLNGTNIHYVEEMYASWRRDKNSVHVSWQAFFDNLQRDAPLGEGWVMPPTLGTSPHFLSPLSPPSSPVSSKLDDTSVGNLVNEHMKVLLLIRAYQVRGHELATLDPLNLHVRPRPPELQLSTYGLSEADLDREFLISSSNLLSGIMGGENVRHKLKDIIQTLEQTYCGTIGIEYMHIQNRVQSNWVREQLELKKRPEFTKEERITIFRRLLWATSFEKFLATKWNTAKRFGLEGGESLIPGLKELIDISSLLGVKNVIIGMAHRGRLNVIGNVLRRPLPQIFHEFEHGINIPEVDSEEWGASGDVKYHLGTSCDRETLEGRRVHISVLSNPSHLEAVNPVVEGKARCKQYLSRDHTGESVMSIQIHGDASFPGQGVVYETINLSSLPDYSTGGTIHVVINNQIGFTTDTENSRSGIYCTDPVKVDGVPIFHVNGNDVEAVVRVMRLAAQYRHRFRSDVCVDIVCYRRFGHNEIDEPAFTQPIMYKKIRSMETTLSIYKNMLIDQQILTPEAFEKMSQQCLSEMSQSFEEAKKYVVQPSDWLESRWHGFKGPAQLARIKPTGVNIDILKEIGRVLYTIPKGFNVHSALKRVIEARRVIFETGKGVDWATAEALAFGSLILEGNHVRLAGQDVQRGTFSHRHAVWIDQQTNGKYVPLNHLVGAREQVHFVNSCLSEYACMGFELGYSLESPNSLVCWEGQFGDFVNGAQVVIDQFLSCGEQKWFRQTALTLLLPHGYEGQGPEHSSARLDRFLHLSDGDPEIIVPDAQDALQRTNWAVVNCSTPANYFHILRQQIHREYRKPLVIFTPKSLLRHPLCKSDLSLFDDRGVDQGFQMVIGEMSNLVTDNQVKRVIFCSGKLFWDLFGERQTRNINDIALVRVEMLAPFPFTQAMEQITKYPNAEVVWAQEEHKNMGAWHYIYFCFQAILKQLKRDRSAPIYVGRSTSASPATGSMNLHKIQYEKLVRDAFKYD